MDATIRGTKSLLVLALFILASGCNSSNRGSVSTPTASCVAHIKTQSFLVKWHNQVPEEFEAYKLSPNSLITRFQGINKEQVEKLILKKYLDDYDVAEHDFYIKQSGPKQQATKPCDTTNLVASWGPADIQAQDAWAYLNKKGEGVKVAVVDSGVDINHQLLSSQIWHNEQETPGNGIDDDHNGFVDDYSGWNFQAQNNDVRIESTHGTHVSGVIAGQAGDLDFTGVAPKAQIMPLKFINGEGVGTVGDAVSAMEYAVAHGARVINASWGGDLCSDVIYTTIQKVTSVGTVFVTAAGNAGNDLNKFPEWPAAYTLPGKITAGAYNVGQQLSAFSNYGNLVDVAAPGDQILSTVPPQTIGQGENKMCVFKGTSMATPFVSGIAALLASASPLSSAAEIISAINSSVTLGQYGVRTKGKINALKAAQTLVP